MLRRGPGPAGPARDPAFPSLRAGAVHGGGAVRAIAIEDVAVAGAAGEDGLIPYLLAAVTHAPQAPAPRTAHQIDKRRASTRNPGPAEPPGHQPARTSGTRQHRRDAQRLP
jgi:hypothetical protein